jgi:hypothetical protein
LYTAIANSKEKLNLMHESNTELERKVKRLEMKDEVRSQILHESKADIIRSILEKHVVKPKIFAQ